MKKIYLEITSPIDSDQTPGFAVIAHPPESSVSSQNISPGCMTGPGMLKPEFFNPHTSGFDVFHHPGFADKTGFSFDEVGMSRP